MPTERSIFPAMRASQMEGGRFQVDTRLGGGGGGPRSRTPVSSSSSTQARRAAQHGGRGASGQQTLRYVNGNGGGNYIDPVAAARLQTYRDRSPPYQVRQERNGGGYPAPPRHSTYGDGPTTPSRISSSGAAPQPHQQRTTATTTTTPTRQHQPAPQLPTTPGGTATVPKTVSEQLQLFTQLQQTVVQLSQCAVEDKKRIAELQRTLESYQQLIAEQDQMLEELKKVNVKLMAEKEALLAFRGNDATSAVLSAHELLTGHPSISSTAGGALFSRGIASTAAAAHGGGATTGASGSVSTSGGVVVPPISFTPQGDVMSAGATAPAPGDQFTRSLIEQLRAEKRQRLAVEEQASRMMAEQQLLILRLEERYAATAGGGGRPSSPVSGTPRRTGAGALAQHATKEVDATAQPQQQQQPHGSGAASARFVPIVSSSITPRDAAATGVLRSLAPALEEPSLDRSVRSSSASGEPSAAVEFVAALEHELPR